MKWAFLIPRFLPETVGGNIIYVDRFAKELIKAGEYVHIFTTTLDPSLPEFETDSGITVHRIRANRGNAGSLRFSTTKKVTRHFNEVDRKINFDILNPHDPFQINYNLIRSDLKIIHTLHANLTYEYCYDIKKYFLTKDFSFASLKDLLAFPIKLPTCYIREFFALKKASKIIVMSDYVRSTIQSFFLLDKDKIFISRIGINTKKFRPASDKRSVRKELNLCETDIIFFTVRRLAHRMGLENLIYAFNLLLKNHDTNSVKLIIAGKGPLKKRLEKIVKQLNLVDHVRLPGFVADDDLLKLYQSSDVFVLPTEELEGFGIVSLEAFSCNLPVIATPVGANPEVAGSICPSLLTRGKRPKDIFEKMIHYIENKSKYDNTDYVTAAMNYYSWDKIIQEILNISNG